MKEIGGYMSFEQYHLPMLYENGIKLNCGRNALAYLIEVKKIKKIAMPFFMCSSVFDLCRQYGVQLRFYHVGYDFLPEKMVLQDDEWLYLTNYYGQLSKSTLQYYKDKFVRIIVDNAQAYFEDPIENVDTLYTCRKFFGVPDGGILFTDKKLERELEQDSSCEHMMHLLGRYERTGSEFYSHMSENNRRFRHGPILNMSKLTKNLLHSIDYTDVKKRRTDNFAILHSMLGHRNELNLTVPEGAFAYPFLVQNGAALRKRLIENKIYVPTLWPNVLEETEKGTIDFRLAADLLPVPCDQRYDRTDMERIVDLIDVYWKDI